MAKGSTTDMPNAKSRDPADPSSRQPAVWLVAQRAAAATGAAAAVLILLLFLWHITRVLMLLFAGLLLAVLLTGLARLLKARTSLSYGWSLLASGTTLAGLLTLAVWMLAPQVSAQVGELAEAIPQSVARLQQWVDTQPWGRFATRNLPTADEIAGSGSDVWSRITGVMSTAAEVVASILIVLAVGIYLSVNPALYRQGLIRFVPHHARPRAAEVTAAVGAALRRWLAGQAVAMMLVGTLTWLGLLLLGIPLALALGVIAGLFEFVPFFGPIASAVPALLIALLEGPQQALYVALLFLGIQQLENNVITPLVMKEVVSLPPVVTIAATIVAGVLFGVPGILLATPLAVMFQVLIRKLYLEDVLGDRDA